MVTSSALATGTSRSWLAATPYMERRRVATQRAGMAGWMAVVLLLSAEFSGRSKIANALIGVATLVALVNLARIRRTAMFVLPYLLYVAILGFAVNSMPTTPHELYTWLNTDGRIYIAVLPLVVLGTFEIRWADLRLFVKAIQVLVWFDVLLLAAGLGGVGPIRRIVLHKSNFFAFTSSHHAAGYFASAAILILASARRTPELRVIPARLSIVAATGLLIATGSRTSLLGLAGVALWTILSKRKASEIIKVFAGVLAAGAIVIAIGSRFSSTLSVFFTSDFQQQAVGTFEAGLKQHESTHYIPLYGSNAGFVANILARFWYWGTAVSMFLLSPILGIGSFRFNAIDLHYSGIPNLVYFATSGVDNSANLEGAHDQYLGTLVETGVVGLALLLMMWLRPYRQLRKAINKPASLRLSGCQMAPFAFATAFTGYTLAAPSLTFVALTWLTLTVLVPDPEDAVASVAERGSPPPPKARVARRSRFTPRARVNAVGTSARSANDH